MISGVTYWSSTFSWYALVAPTATAGASWRAGAAEGRTEVVRIAREATRRDLENIVKGIFVVGVFFRLAVCG